MQEMKTLYRDDQTLCLIDQTLLPTRLETLRCDTVESVWEAIKTLRVRGAPAIGCAAAYGTCVGLRTLPQTATMGQIAARLREVTDYLASSRPTAVNLFWALDRMKRTYQTATQNWQKSLDLSETLAILWQEADAIFEEDRQMCRAIGRHGAALLQDGWGVLTHCNAGALATSDYGTALAVFYAGVESGKRLHVFADETRPLLQGARLTTWELQQHGVPVTLLCDNMAAQVMREGRIQAVVVGADRIAANGDAANKIGTYGVAILAKYHQIPFYVAAPSSTFDRSISTGADIPIEQRDSREVTHGFGRQTAPDGVDVYNPAFDVTPAELIAGIITEVGVLCPGQLPPQ
ncbi:MAG: S-methyl-5-thioribose-1-phosphate isomerase [Thermoguttaceae bacterium]|nr:S-methyl-5-thioribose-1-phosphate isomerase [Thermoguttaceae bacterium]